MTKRHLPTTQCDSTTDRIKDALPVGFMEGNRMKEHTAEGDRAGGGGGGMTLTL